MRLRCGTYATRENPLLRTTDEKALGKPAFLKPDTAPFSGPFFDKPGGICLKREFSFFRGGGGSP